MASMFGNKRIGVFFGALISAALLCGCHGAREKHEFAVPEKFDTAKDITLTF